MSFPPEVIRKLNFGYEMMVRELLKAGEQIDFPHVGRLLEEKDRPKFYLLKGLKKELLDGKDGLRREE